MTTELMIRLLADAGILAAVAGILAFLVRRWISQAIDLRYSQILEKTKASIEVAKHQTLSMLEAENAVYPEVVELVYRLRNSFRDRLEEAAKDVQDLARWDQPPATGSFGEELYVLTEKLYKYRAHLSEPIFQDMHRFKQVMQDAEVLFDRINRRNAPGDEHLFVERFSESKTRLSTQYLEVDALYAKITNEVRHHLRKALAHIGETTEDSRDG